MDRPVDATERPGGADEGAQEPDRGKTSPAPERPAQRLAGAALRFDVAAEVELPAGGLLALQPGILHEVEAVEESALLLTVAGFRGGHVEGR